ncbi:hypothetical protein PLANPX_2188 [Lacipirellula parvula]|uniref:Uncharacterized protein n=1 Tax=Lacipirellula parvula TaxID=2650471 RepID=A0A5K7XE09_9BACT|nr:hypothetical protein PLANPX_2188 [Lacipirellula parvula]
MRFFAVGDARVARCDIARDGVKYLKFLRAFTCLEQPR